MRKIIDIIRFTLIAVIIGMLVYKLMHSGEILVELHSYLRVAILVLLAVEAFRFFGLPRMEK